MKSKASDDICTACSLSSSLPPLIWCIDCGDEIEVSIKDTMTCRCRSCQRKYRNDYMQNLMENKRHSS